MHIVFRSRVHEHRDKRFAGSEDKDKEQDPWCGPGFICIVDMGVLRDMVVFVDMVSAVVVKMGMSVLPLSVQISYADYHVHKSERYEQPCGNISPERFNRNKPVDRQADSNSGKAQQNRTEDMSHTAKESDQHCFPEIPFSCLAKHYEGQVMIGPQYCMDKAQ